MLSALTLLALAVHLWWAALRFKDELHLLQLNSYFNTRYLRWLAGHPAALLRLPDLLPFAAFLLPVLGLPAVVVPLAWSGLHALIALAKRPRPQKKPLVMTPRATRLYGALLALPALTALVLLLEGETTAAMVAAGLLTTLAPFTLLLVNTLVKPLEWWINRGYFREAQALVRALVRAKPGLTVIGITGSFGKTSTKLILGQLLGGELTTLVTPGSYNTPMGVTRVIREQLKPIHRVFVAEMGAKKRGDIRELCALAGPSVGVLTAIGEQHLETFGSLQGVADTKAELIEALPADGLAVLNGDDPNVRAVAGRTRARTVCYGIDGEGLDYRAEGIRSDGSGSRFRAVTPKGEVVIETRLLGAHNILNVMAGVAVAAELGLPLERIARAARGLKPAPHRLQLHRSGDGVTIIDDAFNANPVGVMSALEVLRGIEGGRKILVTPGLIELGERQESVNHAVGEKAAECADYVILVGPNQTRPVRAGLEAKGWPAERLFVARNLDEARAHLDPLLRPGDVVLFENDLPDTFNE